MIDYTTNGAKGAFYTNRTYLLHSIFAAQENDVGDKSINAFSNINELLFSLMNNYCNIKRVEICEYCSFSEEENVSSIDLPNANIVWNNYKVLEMNLNHIFKHNKISCCDVCFQSRLKTIYCLNNCNYLWIATDDAYHDYHYDKTQKKKIVNTGTTRLTKLPNTLKILEKRICLKFFF